MDGIIGLFIMLLDQYCVFASVNPQRTERKLSHHYRVSVTVFTDRRCSMSVTQKRKSALSYDQQCMYRHDCMRNDITAYHIHVNKSSCPRFWRRAMSLTVLS